MRVFPYHIRCINKAGTNVFSLALCLLLSLSSVPGDAQRAKIDSIKKSLPYLHDSALVDAQNALSLIYTYLQPDSAKYYAEKAYRAAFLMNYLEGLIIALNNKARIEGVALQNFSLQEKICLQILQQYKNVAGMTLLADTYMNLALALFFQGYFDRSTEACTTVIQHSQKAGNKKRMGEATAILGSISFEKGDYEKSFQDLNKSLDIFKSNNDSYNKAIVLAKIGDLYRLAGDNKTALNLYSESLENKKSQNLEWYPLEDLGDTYYALEPYDPTLYEEESYLQTIKSMTIRNNYTALPRMRAAEMEIASNKYDKAIGLLIEELNKSAVKNNKTQLMRLLFDMAKAYEGKKAYKPAFTYTTYLLQNAKTHQAKQYIRDGYKLMSVLYGHTHHVDSAYHYYQQYTSMKEYVALDEFSKKLAIYKAATESEKKRAQIELLKKGEVISQQQLQLSRQQLKSESFLKNILVTSVLFLALLGFIIFRNITLKRKYEKNRHEIVEQELILGRMESERTKNEMQKKATELEIQALRAQMNPHFIFNCLNSINRFIIGNEASRAADHLTKFARLIRIVLEQSGKSFVTLADEMYCLQLYMDLEKLRFEMPFQYEIDTNQIDTSAVMIPSLLIQPFVENAIWHGLQGNKSRNGRIHINVNLENGILYCKITDNGVGREKKTEMSGTGGTGKSSLGIELTRTRLQLIDPSKRENVGVFIEDLTTDSGKKAGTCVHLNIPAQYL